MYVNKESDGLDRNEEALFSPKEQNNPACLLPAHRAKRENQAVARSNGLLTPIASHTYTHTPQSLFKSSATWCPIQESNSGIIRTMKRMKRPPSSSQLSSNQGKHNSEFAKSTRKAQQPLVKAALDSFTTSRGKRYKRSWDCRFRTPDDSYSYQAGNHGRQPPCTQMDR